MMRLAYIAHSLVAERQILFASELRRQLQSEGGDLLEIYPTAWPGHYRAGGYLVDAPGDMMRHRYAIDAWATLHEWEPDIVLVQQEAYCASARQTMNHCIEHSIPYVTFSWENAVPPDHAALRVLDEAAVNLYGNSDAFRIAEAAGARHTRLGTDAQIVPQVGIDANVFRPSTGIQEYDIVFAGRRDPMKGEAVLDVACAGQAWRVLKVGQTKRVPYKEMGSIYRSAVIQCVPSVDLPNHPREQFAPATSIEGLLCGVPVVASDQAAVQEWLRDCPAAYFAPMGDAEALREKIRKALGEAQNLSVQARTWALTKFRNEQVAQDYLRILGKAA